MKKAYIYILIDPETQLVRYVGKTTYKKLRFQNHLSDKTKTHRGSWIRSLRSKGLRPEYVVIEECTTEDWNELEIYWIAQFKAWNFPLTNHTTGGEGSLGAIRSEEFKENLSKMWKGVPKPESFRPHTTKLTTEGVIKIKEKLFQGKLVEEIVKELSELNLTLSQVNEIACGRTWRKVKFPNM